MDFRDYDTRLAAYVLLTDRAGRILLTWFKGDARSEPGWTMPGGGVEFDESLQDAAVREAYEETGYHVALGPLLADHHFTVGATADRRPFRSQRFIFEATITGGELGTTEVDGTTEVARWLPVAEVPALPRADIVDVALTLLEDRPTRG